MLILSHPSFFLKGVLRGIDQFANVVVEDSHERVYGPQGVEQVVLGLYIIRGDNMLRIPPPHNGQCDYCSECYKMR